MTSHQRKISAIASKLLAWFAANARDLPWRRTRDPYAIWVSEIMLQQTQVKTVIPFWERWLRELPTIAAAANASPAKLHKLWEGLGYYTRVRNLQKAAQVIVAQHGGRFPERFDDVLALPGIGRYTAGAICSIAFNQPAPILDGNVIRVLTRIFGIPENPKEKPTNQKLWQLAQELVSHASRLAPHFAPHSSPVSRHSSLVTRHSSPACSHLNQSLMELGALVCTPRNPQCSVCPVQKLCIAFKNNRIEELPNLGKREPATARRFMALVIQHKGKFLVRQRPAGVVNAHLWEFPNMEVGAPPGGPRQVAARENLPRVTDPRSGAVAAAAKHILGFSVREISPLITIKHSITRYRITLEAFKATLGGRSPHLKTDAVWKTPAQLRHLAFTSAHRKVLHAMVEDF